MKLTIDEITDVFFSRVAQLRTALKAAQAIKEAEDAARKTVRHVQSVGPRIMFCFPAARSERTRVC
jgi:hypothetical protein